MMLQLKLLPGQRHTSEVAQVQMILTNEMKLISEMSLLMVLSDMSLGEMGLLIGYPQERLQCPMQYPPHPGHPRSAADPCFP